MSTTLEHLPASAEFSALGTQVSIHVTDARHLREAAAVAHDQLAALDSAASRFRDDSEVMALSRHRSPVDTTVSPLLADHLAAALRAARLTDGLVDPTVGTAVVQSGYDSDLAVVRDRVSSGAALDAPAPTLAGWRSVHLDTTTRRLQMPAGVLLDLGATAKALAADRLAADLAHRFPGGFLVNLGGDLARAGDPPASGWKVGIEDAQGTVLQTLAITSQAVASSSTQKRRWTAPEGHRHHIIDPRTGRTSTALWAQITCLAGTCVDANTASTAAIVLGDEAPQWLSQRGVAARLDRVDGVVVTTGAWPRPAATTTPFPTPTHTQEVVR